MNLMKKEMEFEFCRRATNSVNHALYDELEFSREFIFDNLDKNSLADWRK